MWGHDECPRVGVERASGPFAAHAMGLAQLGSVCARLSICLARFPGPRPMSVRSVTLEAFLPQYLFCLLV